MQIDQTPPVQNIQNLLQFLKIKSIEQLFSNQQFNIDSIAKTANTHKIIIYEHLNLIQKIIAKPFSLQNKINIKLDPIFTRWIENDKQSLQKFENTKWVLNENNIMEIIGRVNGGKSYLMNQIIIQCLKTKQNVIYLDSNQNIQKLYLKINQEIQNQTITLNQPNFKSFKFRSLCQLSMLLHCIGDQLIQRGQSYTIFIDSIGQTQQPQKQHNPAISSMQYKFVDRFKKLLIQISQFAPIVYITRCGNSNTLFNQVYRLEKHRPKYVGSTPKHWDNIASKTICVDYSQTQDRKQHWKLMSTKSINYKPFTLIRAQL